MKYSFVLPVKNGSRFIQKTIKSLQNQTEKEIEIIIVNDHSTDHTVQIVDKIAEKDDRIKLFHLPKDKTGEGAGRNFGTRHSIGEIILPTDADDPNYPKRAEVSKQELITNQADIFYGNLERFFPEIDKKEIRHFQPYDAKLLRYINYIASAGASAYYRYVFDKIGGYDESLKTGTDYDFWLKAQEIGFKFCCKNIPLSQYTMHTGQVTGNRNDPEKIKKRQEWNRLIKKKHKIYDIDLDYVKKNATPEVLDFYVNKNYEIWFGEESIPTKT